MTRFHSRTFTVLSTIAADLADASWPTHPTSDRIRPVINPSTPDTLEAIEVLYRVEDDAEVAWATISPGLRDETFLVDVVVWTRVPGQVTRDLDPRALTWARLEELCGIVQALYYDLDGGYQPPDVDGLLPLGGLVRVAPRVYRTDQGWEGEAVVTFRFTSRI